MSPNGSDERPLLEVFIKSVQYIVSLKTQQDVREHIGMLITTQLPAEWVAFAHCDGTRGIGIRHCTLDGSAAKAVLMPEIEGLVADVLESGFIACDITSVPSPSMTAFLPIVEESHPREVMVVGHSSTSPIPKDLLDVYLAIAGLAGTTLERLGSEIELARHRSHLEELVRDRTLALQTTNEQLVVEVSQRQAAQQALHRESERLSVTLRSIGDGVIATDTESRVVLLNGVAEELTGWTLDEARGRPIAEVFDIVNEQTREPAVIPVAKALQTGAVVELANHTVLVARDGTEHSIADSCAPIRALDGSIVGAVLVFRDVTEQHRSERLRDTLDQLNVAISSSLDVDSIMLAVVDEAVRALGCEKAIVTFFKEGAWEVSHTSEDASSLVHERFQFKEARGQDAQGADPLLLSGAELHEMLPRRLIASLGAESIVFMPVAVRGQVVAALSFVNLPQSPSFVRTQLDFIRKLGASLSLALENARLYEAERLIAETLQEALICIPQVVPGMELGHHYHSATKAARVGGDFYDVFQIRPGRIGLVMGDVAGHGLSAATLAVLVQNTMKALAYQGQAPSEVMSKANDIIKEETEDNVFVTIFFGVLDTEHGRLSYCSGGHPPAILKRSGGDIELLKTEGPIVGAFEGLEFVESVTRLGRGDTLVLYTDGVIEARTPGGEFFGQARLVNVVDGLGEASESAQIIFDRVLEFTGGALNDDVAILSLSLVEELGRV